MEWHLEERRKGHKCVVFKEMFRDPAKLMILVNISPAFPNMAMGNAVASR